MNIVFQERSIISSAGLTPPPVQMTVERYSHAAIGGPRRATIRATGALDDLIQFLAWLRVKVVITGDGGRPVWWGYIHRVDVEAGQVRFSVSLDRVATRVAVAYTSTSVAESSVGERQTTDWAEDGRAVRVIGRKEVLLSATDTTLTGAEAMRDRALADLKLVHVGLQPKHGATGPTAVIECRGWWSTLAWRYASVPTSLALAFETIGEQELPIGNGAYQRLAQAFDISAAVNLQQIAVYIGKVGSPADNVTIAIHENPDDVNPGTELVSQTVPGATLSTAGGWVTVTLPSTLPLAAGTYFLVISRTGGQDGVNYYITQVDEEMGYGGGPLLYYNGTNYVAYNADLPFRLYDNALVETTQQIAALLTNYGQFLGRVHVEDPSGIYTESYRDGDTTAQFEIDQLLGVGGPNKRRLLATVNPDRSVRIYEQPSSDSQYSMDIQGNVWDAYGNPIAGDTCPVGVWVVLKDVIRAVGVQPFFLEEAEYSVPTGGLSFQTSNSPNPFNWGIENG